MATITNLAELDLTKQYSYSDYLLWEFQDRVELIKGFISKMSPDPNLAHQTIVNNLTGIFYINFKDKPCRVFQAPFDVRLPIESAKKNATVVQPDLCVVCDESKLDSKGCNGTPDLMVEVLSPKNSRHDVHTKFNLYQEAGVKEYWIIDPSDKLILVYSLFNGIFVGLKPQVEGEQFKSPLFPDLELNLEDLFSNV